VSRRWIRKFSFDVPSREEQIGTPGTSRCEEEERGARGRRGGREEGGTEQGGVRKDEKASREQRGSQEEPGGAGGERYI